MTSLNDQIHVCIIMDGNGRWAKRRKLPVKAGHKKGAETLQKIVKTAPGLGIKTLTLYSFSSENWNRPKDEVDDLMNLLRHYLRDYLKKISENNVKLKIIGNVEKLPLDIQNDLNKINDINIDQSELTLVLAVSYGGQEEIVSACRQIAENVQNKNIALEDINEEMFSNYLYDPTISNPDLFIRTSGEQRISNFLLWQIAYTELYFTEKLWPDFSEEDLKEALNDFHKRVRRYGARE